MIRMVNEKLRINEKPTKTEENVPNKEKGVEVKSHGFEFAAVKLGKVNQKITELEQDPRVTPEEKGFLTELRTKMYDAFSEAYNTVKNSSAIHPFQQLSEKFKESLTNTEKEDIEGEDLTFFGKVADFIIAGNISEVLEKFQKYSTERKNDIMSKEEIEFREKIANTVWPSGYSGTRTVFNLITNQQPYTKEKLLENSPQRDLISSFTDRESEITMINYKREIVRHDLFRMYLGLEQDFDSMIESPDKPTIAKDSEAKYYAFKKEDLINTTLLFIKSNNSHSEKKIENFNDFLLETKEGGLFRGLPGQQLGTHKVGMGFDEKTGERYISYYDYWDIDPPILKTMGIDIDKYNFPFEVYGRLYENEFNNAINARK